MLKKLKTVILVNNTLKDKKMKKYENHIISDIDYLKALEQILDEWHTPNDAEDYDDLISCNTTTIKKET